VPLIDIKAFHKVAAKDPEFLRAMRYYDGAISVSVGDAESYVLTFEDGKMLGVAEGPAADAVISVKATPEQWSAMLETFPKPFYQCLQSSAVRHGVELSGSDQTFAYLPALNRMMQLLRSNQKAG
jgi:hypothetical protein